MTTAGRVEVVVHESVGLCDVPQPKQTGRHDHQANTIGREHQHRTLGTDRRGDCSAERRRSEALGECVDVLPHEQVPDPLVGAVVDAVNEPHCDELDGQDVDQPGAQRRCGLPDQDTESEPDGSLDRECEPDRAEAFHDVSCCRPRDVVALERSHDDSHQRTGDKQHDRQYAHPRREHNGAAGPHGQAAGMLREHGFQGSPPEFGAGEQRSEDNRDRRADGKCCPHDGVDELVGIESEDGDESAAISSSRVQGLVPVEAVHQHRDARDETRGHEERRSESELSPLRFDGCDHDPCFSPVSWKKTSSSDLSNGRSSLTPTPAPTSSRLMSMLCAGSVARWMKPSWRLTAAAPNIRRRISAARSDESALTRTPFSPISSRTVDCLPTLPPLLTPTRSQICSTSPRRWLDSSTVRSPWPMSLMSLRISAMPCGSSPLVGSSRMSRSGSFSSAPATPSRCFIPVEYVPNLRPALDVSSTMSSTSSTRFCLAPARSARTRRFSRPERYG